MLTCQSINRPTSVFILDLAVHDMMIHLNRRKGEDSRDYSIRRLLQAHYDGIMGQFRRLGNLFGLDEASVEDLSHEAMLIALRKCHQLKDVSSFKPWLMTIFRNSCLADIKKSRFFQNEGLEGLEDQASPSESLVDPGRLDDLYLYRELGRRVSKMKNQTQALVIRKYFFDEMTAPEIAAEMGLKLNTVYSHVYRGQRRLLRDDPMRSVASCD
ncbi:RNA polymerase sigma factor [Pseudobacteriovorax antillogorgiicola]|uniref:RNA polymerase sigma factor, sigma-70 family n=1 Tax=Pseudobacteriovorax antillogorgiicola TaxID=1513793 RepID=A0A1Y6BEF2_9BACT|nr:sigma-70 family RNA polymerase sigma factor [Pseudobacteriovorax antillogorgiicola]TCS57278.1 RNA polymerase sigma factor (sigma-70 family) [Pseudobacteriovorax antillogorgiicola]SMF03153.1 RNA polymerase sigma factor, sigma-70 family [Pseudobacteriovorax antillogorgiicola]